MKLFYIDESGTGFKDRNSPYFILAAFAIDARDWRSLDTELSRLKKNIFDYMSPEDFEIKGRDIRRGDKVFKSIDWRGRLAILGDIAALLRDLPCRAFAVSFDKSAMREQISSEEEAYRITFSRLLNMLNDSLLEISDDGFLLIDSRSDLHSSVQDRRLVDVYRHWTRDHDSRFIELPWFGFSAFYSGLQLADFCGYLLDFEQNEVILEDTLKAEFLRLYNKHEDSALIDLLHAGDLREVRKFLEKADCNRLRNLINKNAVATLLGIIEKRLVDEGAKLLTNTERHQEVINLVNIFRGKVVLSKIP